MDVYPELINYDKIIQQNRYKNYEGEPQRVAYSFVVEKDGSISNIKLENGSIDKLNQETLRLLKKIEFNPAQKNDGIHVRCQCVFLIRYPS